MYNISENMGKLPHLLLVDDDFTSLAFMKKYLEGHFVLHAASDAKQALKLISENDYFGFLIDIKLGTGMNGLSLMNELRNISRYKSAPIIAVTAFFKPSDIKYLKSKGFDDVVIKPFKRETLLEILNTQIFI